MNITKTRTSQRLTLWRCMRGYAHCDAAIFREIKKPYGERDDALVDEYIALCDFYREKIAELRAQRRNVFRFNLQKVLVYAIVLFVGLGVISGVTEAAGLTHIWSAATQFVKGIFYYDYHDESGDVQDPESSRAMWDVLLSDAAFSSAVTAPREGESYTYGDVSAAEKALGVKLYITDDMFFFAQVDEVSVQRKSGLHIHAAFSPEVTNDASYIGITLHITDDEYHSQLYVSGAGESEHEVYGDTDITYIEGDEDRVYVFSVRRDGKCYSYCVSASLDIERSQLRAAVSELIDG